MKINGIDIKKYDAKQLTADVQPPSFSNSYEWLTGAALPTEFETEVQMGHLKLSIYFKGKDRNNIIRAASEFMSNFTKACKMELDGYKGTYIGFITTNDYEKKNVKQRYIVNLEFDGFFVDDDLSIAFDGKTSASFYKVGTRDAPCVVEVYAKSALTNYTITGLGAVNNKIGYCQSHRGTFWTNLADSNFDPAQITVACEADCSSGVAAIVKGAGYRLGIDALKKVSTACYTGNLRAALKAAGFEVLTENKYLTSDAYLLAGDILLNDGAHTATNLTDGAKSSGAGASNTTPVKSNTKVDVAHGFNKSLAGTYKVTASGLNLRAGAGTGKSILAVMNHDEKVQCYGYYNDCNGVKWLYVVYKNIVGYASSKYLSK